MLHPLLEPYALTLIALGLSAGLLLTQLLIVDVSGMRARHKPGHPITPDPANFLFRASRAHANTNESYTAFVALVVFGIAVSAHADWLERGALLYVAGRAGHMLCYYAGLALARSVFFGLSLVGLFLMLGAGLLAL